MLNNKEMEILNKLIGGKRYSFKEISEKYNISDRAARYYINNIDYVLEILGYRITEKDRNMIMLDTGQDFRKILEVLKENRKLSSEERQDIMKLILFFDKEGLNVSRFSSKYDVSRTTAKKDMKVLENELKEYEIELVYINGKGYKLSGNKQKILVKLEEVTEKILEQVEKKTEIISRELLDIFYSYIRYGDIERIKKFILKIEKIMQLSINKESYNKIIAYISVILNDNWEKGNNGELLAKSFLCNTDEYAEIRKVLLEIFKDREVSEAELIRIADLIMGMSINGLKNNSFEDWIDEELMIRKMIVKISKIIGQDLSGDEVLHEGLLYHIKPAMYRMKNGIQIVNSVFKELIITEDPILKVVKQGINEIEKIFNVEFPEDEIALIGFHIKAAMERNTVEKSKKVILVCGLGYGSSKVLEQSLKENYDLDIVDVLSYSFIENTLPIYKNIDIILTTIDFSHDTNIPVVRINPLLKDEDMKLLSEYAIKKNKNRISLKSILNIIERDTVIENRRNLIDNLKKEFGNRIVDDLTEAGFSLKEFLNKENVEFIEKVENWEEAIRKSGEILVRNNISNKRYVEEMVRTIRKFGAYIIIEEGIAIPHAPISENVFKTGIGLLVVKERVYFPNGKGANIFMSFAAKDRSGHEIILKDLFELITKHKFIEKISKIRKYDELEKYFGKE